MKTNETNVAPVAASRPSQKLGAPYRAEATSMLLMMTGLDATYAALNQTGGTDDDRNKRH